MHKNAVVVTPFAAQRFLSSAINQWKTIEKGFSVLHAAFYIIQGQTRTFPSSTEFFGQDFVSDLGLLDITAPLSELMILSQAIDFFHWKVVFWGERMLLWMEEILGNIRELPRFKKHLAEIENFQFQGVKILEGWKLVNREEIERPEDGANVVYNWEERTVDESIADLEVFASDLRDSSRDRLERGTAKVSELLSDFLDFEKLLVALEGDLQRAEQSQSPVHCLKNKQKFWKIGKQMFRTWFKYVVSLSHVKAKADNYGRLDESCAEAVYQCFKEVLCELCWGDLREYGIGCFLAESGKPLKQYFTSLAPDTSTSTIRQIFRLTLLNGKQVKAVLDEPVLIETLYNVKEIYSRIGPEFMIALDVALATGGSEAIAESFYSVMDAQKQRCHQSNRIMELRAKIDWLLPHVGNHKERLVEGIAKKFLENHRSPLLKDSRSIAKYFRRNRQSKVIYRIANSCVKYPHLL